MRTLRKNKVWIWYAVHTGEEPVYATDAQGNTIYDTVNGVQVPRDTGSKRQTYSDPVKFLGNIVWSRNGRADAYGMAKREPYGVSTADYDATIITGKGETQIRETSLIWVSEPPTGDTKGDFVVTMYQPSLNYDKFMLEKVV